MVLHNILHFCVTCMVCSDPARMLFNVRSSLVPSGRLLKCYWCHGISPHYACQNNVIHLLETEETSPINASELEIIHSNSTGDMLGLFVNHGSWYIISDGHIQKNHDALNGPIENTIAMIQSPQKTSYANQPWQNTERSNLQNSE